MAQVGQKDICPERWSAKKKKEGNPVYTNLVVWATFRDGVNRCPALLFSGDPLFGPRSRDKKGVDEKLEKFGVVRDRIVFCAGKQFVSENPSVIKTFLDRYSWLQKALIISDNGQSFKKK
jgi:hypothetical protein